MERSPIPSVDRAEHDKLSSDAIHPDVSRTGIDRSANGISVVMASYRAPSETLGSLRTLVHQSLDSSRFELVLVVNGSQADDVSAYEQFGSEHPNLQMRIIRTPISGAAHALNLGIEAARMNWITFLDDDDTLSPRFLEGLLTVAGPGVMPITFIHDVMPDGTIRSSNRINDQLLPYSGKVVSVDDCPRGISFNASKLIPTDWARHILYDVDLKSGQDIAFYGAMYMAYDFDFAVVPAEFESVYYRLLSDSSQSRRKLDFDFAVSERLDVIESLTNRLDRAEPRKHAQIESLVRAQAGFMRRFLDQNPERRGDVNSVIRQRGLRTFPGQVLTRGTAKKLIVSVCFPPYSDPSAVTVAKRMLEAGEVADVVCSDMSEVRDTDPSLDLMVNGLVGSIETIAPSVSFSDWSSVRSFSVVGWNRLERRLKGRWPYQHLYSRAMWPASHILAALIKARRPSTHWTAEFSDPLSRDVEGNDRWAALKADDLSRELMAAARTDDHMDLAFTTNFFEFAEMLPFALADEIVFTNSAQLDYMLSYCTEPVLIERVRARASIQPHPIPPADLYHLVTSNAPPRDKKVRIAYFGAFYVNRSLDDVLSAISSLSIHERRRLVLDVYTDHVEALRRAVVEKSLFDVVTLHPTIGYLSFLNLSSKYDCLIVEDAHTAETHARNPYLPSKWSDYRGSGTPIWAIVEPNSTLSGLDNEYTSRIGSVEQAAEVLRRLLNDSEWEPAMNQDSQPAEVTIK